MFLPFFTYFFFQFLLNVRIDANEELCRTCRKISIIVYLCHYFFRDLHLSLGMESGPKMFLIVVAEALLFSTAIVLMSKKIKLLKYLY